jgi:hypothetical protein
VRSTSDRGLPGEGILAALVVLALVLATLVWPNAVELATRTPQDDLPAATVNSELAGAVVTPIVQDTAGVTTSETDALQELPVATPDDEEAGQQIADSTAALEGAIFPAYRVVSYYGFPGEASMGILGEYEKEQLLEILREQAAEYEAVDPSRPVKLALEVITSVAQGWEGEDGDYLAYIGRDMLMEYVDFTAQNDILLILDMQFGRKTVQEEFEAVREFLLYPHVHLALDPEFSIDEGEAPGAHLGQIDAVDVQYAMEELAALSVENSLPPKLLIVHQFVEQSITNREQIQLVPGVQFVLEVDGFGTPDAKRETYAVITAGSPSEFFGFKLWYNLQDDPLMTPAEVLALDPSPDLIIYQ